jgi:hypothetical protein
MAIIFAIHQFFIDKKKEKEEKKEKGKDKK